MSWRPAYSPGGQAHPLAGPEVSDPKGCVRTVLHTIIFKEHLTADQWDALNLVLAPGPTAV